ncbi:hypothetical protein B0H16DRAFT_813090 [Mycena metata]|uniref:Uncharacterized protein n=1 Tax=Mycena metata TaxID=1033252 RepID=A0AAD7IZQ0_9AGAR|nr:hypothetical protein B0H16DRAFT_813090 [Mycena metata]
MINSQVAVLISPLYLGCGNSSFVVCVDPVFSEDARVLKISQVFGAWISATVLARLHPREASLCISNENGSKLVARPTLIFVLVTTRTRRRNPHCMQTNCQS